MKRLRMKLVLGIVTLAVGSLLLLGATEPEMSGVWTVYFVDGTTLEEASLIFEEFDGLEYQGPFVWAYPNEMTTWSGGITYGSKSDNIVKIRSQHWQKYYSLVASDIRVTAEIMADPEWPSGSNTQQQHDAMIVERERLVQKGINDYIDNCRSYVNWRHR